MSRKIDWLKTVLEEKRKPTFGKKMLYKMWCREMSKVSNDAEYIHSRAAHYTEQGMKP